MHAQQSDYPPRNIHRGARCNNAEQLVNTKDVLDGTKSMTNDVRMNMWDNACGSGSRRNNFNTAGTGTQKARPRAGNHIEICGTW